ncbi:unnamed protein product [Prunus armeniaca]|uniref:Uncharacterized protein n=1 Tax=Prunus armeniaca TaxID=36596 RepID=A0A6J5TEJ4_PRUAR|nr:unnamed protein product [Prunus armeniaca]
MGAYINLGALMGIPTAVLLAFVLHMGGKHMFFTGSLDGNHSGASTVKKASDRVHDAMAVADASS